MPGGPLPKDVVYTLIGARNSVVRCRICSFYVSFVTPLFEISSVDDAVAYFCCAVCGRSPH